MKQDMKLVLLSLFLTGFIGIYSSCTKDHTQLPVPITCGGVSVTENTYNLKIAAILTTNCATPNTGCHEAGSGQYGVTLTNYTNTLSAFTSKNALCGIEHGSGCAAIFYMPYLQRKLPDSLITYIQCWAQNGYPQ